MDPLSTVATISGLMDCFSKLWVFLSTCISAGKEMNNAVEEINSELKFAEVVLKALNHFMTFGAVMLEYSQFDFEELQRGLARFCEALRVFLEDVGRQSTSRTRDVMRRFGWPSLQRKLKELRELLSKHKQDINLAFTIFTFMRGEQQLQKDFLTWLSVPGVTNELEARTAKRHPGTGGWFLESGLFRRFKTENSQHIWIQGNLGSGKTVLSSSIIKNLQENAALPSSPTVAVVYFFFPDRPRDERSVYNMLSAIAFQSCRHCRRIPPEVLTIYRANIGTPPTFAALQIMITHSFGGFEKVFVVLDAIDAVFEQEMLLSTIQQLMSIPNTNVLMTSRRGDFLAGGFSSKMDRTLRLIQMPVSHIKEDICRCISAFLRLEPITWTWTSGLKLEVELSLSTRSEGMFLWVSAQLAIIKQCRRPEDIRLALRSLPQPLETLYKETITRIPQQHHRLSARLLAWVAFSTVPLKVAELAEAIVVDVHTLQIDSQMRLLDPVSDIQLLGGSLIAYENALTPNEDALVFLSHPSVKEYLVSNSFSSHFPMTPYSLLFQNIGHYLANTCLTYWSMAIFRSTLLVSESATAEGGPSKKEFPFLSHAIEAYFHYVTQCVDSQQRRSLEERSAMLLYDGNTLWENVKMVMASNKGMFLYSPFTLFAGVGCLRAVEIGIQRGYDTNIQYGEYETVLVFAAQSGNLDIVRCLLQNGAKDVVYLEDPDSKTKGEYSPALYYAVQAASSELVSLLLQHGSLTTSPHYRYGTLLLHGKFPMDATVKKLLLDHGTSLDPEFQRTDGLCETFVGEAVRYPLLKDDISLFKEFLNNGLATEKPVREHNSVVQLFRISLEDDFHLYFVPNIFVEAALAVPLYNEGNSDGEKLKTIFSLLLDSGAAINSLNCVIGTGPSGCIPQMQYCTAMDLLLQIEEENKEAFYTGMKAHSFCISVLAEYGGMVLEREPVLEREWRINPWYL